MSSIFLSLWVPGKKPDQFKSRSERCMRRIGLASMVDDEFTLRRSVEWFGPFFLESSDPADEYEATVQDPEGNSVKETRRKIKAGAYYNIKVRDNGKKKKSENPAKWLRHNNAGVKYEQMEDATDEEGNPTRQAKRLLTRINIQEHLKDSDCREDTKGSPTETLTTKQKQTMVGKDKNLPAGVTILNESGTVIGRFYAGPQDPTTDIKTPHNVFQN